MRIVRRAATKYQKAVMTQPWYMRYEARYDDIGKYEDRTFFPVYLGDKLDDGRYVIWDKLGSGSKSHVWLAKDQHSGLVGESRNHYRRRFANCPLDASLP
jgi:hypothetical protein